MSDLQEVGRLPIRKSTIQLEETNNTLYIVGTPQIHHTDFFIVVQYDGFRLEGRSVFFPFLPL